MTLELINQLLAEIFEKQEAYYCEHPSADNDPYTREVSRLEQLRQECLTESTAYVM